MKMKNPQLTTLRLRSVQAYNLQLFSGFTLIELIITMAIFAIITAGIWGNYFSSLNKGRDTRRKQDLAAVARALELYYLDNKAYPSPLPAWGSPLTDPANKVIYMQKLPNDPRYPDPPDYCYTTDATGGLYKLYANLDNTNDSAIFATTVQCGNVYYNYGISSQNTTPQ